MLMRYQVLLTDAARRILNLLLRYLFFSTKCTRRGPKRTKRRTLRDREDGWEKEREEEMIGYVISARDNLQGLATAGGLSARAREN